MHLKELANLETLNLNGTQVTRAGVAELQDLEVAPLPRPFCRRCRSGCQATRRRASVYIGGVWIRQPQELNMKRLLGLLLVMGRLPARNSISG